MKDLLKSQTHHYVLAGLLALFVVLDIQVPNDVKPILNSLVGKAVVKEISSIVGLGKPLFGDIPYREHENMELFPDVLKAKQILDWSAKTELREGLIKTIDAFRYE